MFIQYGNFVQLNLTRKNGSYGGANKIHFLYHAGETQVNVERQKKADVIKLEPVPVGTSFAVCLYNLMF